MLYPLSYEGLGGRLPVVRPVHDQSGPGVAPYCCIHGPAVPTVITPVGTAGPLTEAFRRGPTGWRCARRAARP